ncbi:phosphate ABC transporter permease subunit PstC [SAR86 cluster bacterium]|nr:phosphate ABC transporter permease subunit PstC [SAR86 cluster bacterium]|tara:strand:+ start:4180 stop:5556 length:1377 start_codon:yes stop_codon:yes gene_type:complete
MITFLIFTAACLGIVFYFFGKKQALKIKSSTGSLHSLPKYYGYYASLWFLLPSILIIICYLLFAESFITNNLINSLPIEVQSLPDNELVLILNDIKNLAVGNILNSESFLSINEAAQFYNNQYVVLNQVVFYSSLILGLFTFLYAFRSITANFRARNKIENIIYVFLFSSASVAIFATAGILLSVLFEAIRFFEIINFSDFLFGLTWSPQIAIREGQVGSSGLFGAVPLFLGTILISLIALILAVPIGLMTAIYLSEYAHPKIRSITKPMLEILSGIPTVVYGFFAAVTLAPFIRETGDLLGLSIASESALGVGLVMGIMIIPLVSSLSDDVISAVPQAMREGSYGLGATKSETIKKVILPAALPGIVGGILLAASRAIGETMIVVMAAGLSARLSFNPIDAVTTVTVQIVTLLTGDQEFDSPKTLAAFALGLTLFIFTLFLNFIALRVVRKYREQYE